MKSKVDTAVKDHNTAIDSAIQAVWAAQPGNFTVNVAMHIGRKLAQLKK